MHLTLLGGRGDIKRCLVPDDRVDQLRLEPAYLERGSSAHGGEGIRVTFIPMGRVCLRRREVGVYQRKGDEPDDQG